MKIEQLFKLAVSVGIPVAFCQNVYKREEFISMDAKDILLKKEWWKDAPGTPWYSLEICGVGLPEIFLSEEIFDKTKESILSWCFIEDFDEEKLEKERAEELTRLSLENREMREALTRFLSTKK